MTDGVGRVLESTLRGFFLAVLQSPPNRAAANPGVAGGRESFPGGVLDMLRIQSMEQSDVVDERRQSSV